MLKEFWEDLRSSSKAEEESAHEEEGSKRLTPDVTRRVEELVQLIPMASKDLTLFKLLAELRRILQTDSHKFVSAYLRLKFFSDIKVLKRLSQVHSAAVVFSSSTYLFLLLLLLYLSTYLLLLLSTYLLLHLYLFTYLLLHLSPT